MNKILYTIVGIILLASLFGMWRTGALNNYLPFFITTDGWNKYEREINAPMSDETSKVSVTYESPTSSLSVTFDNNQNNVSFTHPLTGTVTLPQVISASGARYANDDESIVFWEHQGEGSLVVQGTELFNGTLESNVPSREAYENCTWKKIVGAGLELWGQSCDFGDKKLEVNVSETLPGIFLEDVTNGSPVAIQQLIQVFALKDTSIDSIIPLLANNENWKDSDKCAFTNVPAERTGVTRYTLMPTGDMLKKFEADGKNEPITSTCAGYGMGNSGVQYFEIYESNPHKVLFIEIGQESPLFDEKTIIVR